MRGKRSKNWPEKGSNLRPTRWSEKMWPAKASKRLRGNRSKNLPGKRKKNERLKDQNICPTVGQKILPRKKVKNSDQPVKQYVWRGLKI